MGKSKKAKKPKEPWSTERELKKLGNRPSLSLPCEHCQHVLETGDTSKVIDLGTALAKRRMEWDQRRAEIEARDLKERTRAAKKTGQTMPEGYAAVAATQEAHSPTQHIAIRDNPPIDPLTGRQIRDPVEHPARQRASQARLMNGMDNWQQDAMVQIRLVIERLFPTVQGQKFERTDPTHRGEGEPVRIDLQRGYFSWARDLQRLGISHATIWAIVMQGKTLEEAEKGHRRGWSRAHLHAGLDHWCWRSGWRKNPTGLVAAAALTIWLRRLCGAKTIYEATRPARPNTILTPGRVNA